MWSDSPARRLTKRVALATAEALWRGTFRAWSRLDPRHPAAWLPAGGRVVVVAPHPDDEVAGCGAAIIAHLAAGDPVQVVIATTGDGSRAGGADAATMRRLRAAEASEAAERLGVGELAWLGHSEADLDGDALRAELAACCAGATRIYAPSGWDFHPIHRAVARAVADAADQGAEIWAVQVQTPLPDAAITHLLPIDAAAPALAAAFAAHRSQRDSLAAPQRMRIYAGLRLGAPGPAEPFAAFDVAGYRRHIATTRPSPAGSLRPSALRDGLAYRGDLRWRASPRAAG